jgi:hypothetical protein
MYNTISAENISPDQRSASHLPGLEPQAVNRAYLDKLGVRSSQCSKHWMAWPMAQRDLGKHSNQHYR